MGGTKDAANLDAAAVEAPLHVPGIDTHTLRRRLVKASLEDASGFAERLQVGALVPGAAGRPRYGRDHGKTGLRTDRCLDLANQRGNHLRTPGEERSEFAAGSGVG